MFYLCEHEQSSLFHFTTQLNQHLSFKNGSDTPLLLMLGTQLPIM